MQSPNQAFGAKAEASAAVAPVADTKEQRWVAYRDRLQDNQRRWMDFFARHNIPATVCKIRWGDDM
ncbi:MAG: VRR-NUC domain-containing protein [Steroidobacteraceae bacterium]